MKTTITIFEEDGKAVLIKNFLNKNAYQALMDEIFFSQERIFMYGKEVTVPRLIAYAGDKSYTYSNIPHPPAPLPATVVAIKQAIESITQFEFNSVLMNLYRTGTDYMGYHRDNEPELDTSLIASASYGATRKFKFKHRQTGKTIDVMLENDDLLLMYNCQTHWLHSLPKSLTVKNPRINLTFRTIIE